MATITEAELIAMRLGTVVHDGVRPFMKNANGFWNSPESEHAYSSSYLSKQHCKNLTVIWEPPYRAGEKCTNFLSLPVNTVFGINGNVFVMGHGCVFEISHRLNYDHVEQREYDIYWTP